jgi:chromosomal replication initiator protein
VAEAFVDILIELGVVTKLQLENAINRQWEKGGKLEESLVRLGYFNENSVFTLMSHKYGYYPISLAGLEVVPETAKLIPYWLAKRFFVVPIKQSDTVLAVAMMNPLDKAAITELKKIVYREILPFIAKKSEIEDFIGDLYSSDIAGKEKDATAGTREGSSEVPLLLRDYTFDNFVTGKSNDFAFSAALGVGRGYERDTNPLFIYSDVGLGKTHLLAAVWNHVIEHEQSRQVLFSSSDKFITRVEEAIESQRITQLREEYVNVDVLLVDDIGLIAGDEVSQQHFFHIFNELFQNSKQIVVTSDCPPKELPALSSRLRSRLEGGLIAKIDGPDLETRISILKFKSKTVGIPDDLIRFVAEHVTGSVRELEGILKEMVLCAKQKKESLAIETVKEILARRLITGVDNE